MTRPARNPLIVASDDTYSSGDHTGEDTKLDPGAAIVSRGWYPGKRRPAKWDNFISNDVGRRLDNIDMAEALNWPEPAPEAGVIASSGSLAGNMAVLRALAGQRSIVYHVNGDDTIRLSGNGYSWSDVHTDAGAAIWDVACSDSVMACAVATESGAAKIIASLLVGGFQTATLTGITDARIIVDDPYREDWFFVGGIATASPRVVRVDASGGLPATQTALTGGGGSARMDLLAVGKDYVLAASTGVASATNVLRRFVYADVAMNAQTQPTSDAIVDLLWCDEDEYFYLFTADAVWRSPTGASGTWVDMSAGLPSGATFLFRGGATRGGLIVCAAEAFGGSAYLLVSGDSGVTWQLVPDPLGRHVGSPQPKVEHVRSIGNRLVCLGYKSAGDVYTAYGLRAGRMI